MVKSGVGKSGMRANDRQPQKNVSLRCWKVNDSMIVGSPVMGKWCTVNC